MARIATSIEESKRLLELGIDPKSADMCYQPYISALYGNGNKCFALHVEEKSSPEQIPAWSLGKLFDIAWELDPNQVLSFQKGKKMDLTAIMVDFIEMLVREVNTKGKEE